MDIIIKKPANNGRLEVISSKSYAIRAILIAAIINSNIKIKTTLSNDILDIINPLEKLGYVFDESNGYYEIYRKENINKANIYIDRSATALRLFMMNSCFFSKEIIIETSDNLSKRNHTELINQMRKVGHIVEGENPICIKSFNLQENTLTFDTNITSQFISAGLIYIAFNGGKLEYKGDLNSKSYIDMTIQTLRDFGRIIERKENTFYLKEKTKYKKIYEVEADYSNASYFLASGAFGKVNICNLNPNSIQQDRKIIDILKDYGANVKANTIEKGKYNYLDIDLEQNIDLFSLIAILMTKKGGVIRNIERLKYKESNRIISLSEMLERLNAKFEINDNNIIIYPSKLKGATINSYDDHRIVMAAAFARNLTDEDIIIENYEAVEKSYPQFFEDFKKLGGDYEIR
ncbi:MAG: hypothetical protein Q4B36_03460 [Tissierellia bacterium]|nr:hypothetical protein [Tissierellia bacterium]